MGKAHLITEEIPCFEKRRSNSASSSFTGLRPASNHQIFLALCCLTLKGDQPLLPCKGEEGKGWGREVQIRWSLKDRSSSNALRPWVHASNNTVTEREKILIWLIHANSCVDFHSHLNLDHSSPRISTFVTSDFERALKALISRLGKSFFLQKIVANKLQQLKETQLPMSRTAAPLLRS